LATAKTPVGTLVRPAAGNFVQDGIPRIDLPETRNTCPLCAQEIGTGVARCPRCGVPLKSEEEAMKLPAELPVPEPTSRAPLGPETSAKEHGIVSPPSSEITPSPAPLGPPRQIEPLSEGVTTAAAEAKISSRGFINGRGATIGMGTIEGRGEINGTGLVNGTGMINGSGLGDRFASTSGKRMTLLNRWQLIAILIAIVIVLPTFIYLSYARQSGLSVDGDFGEWAHVAKYGMQAPAALPEVSVEEWAVQSDANILYLYLKTESNVVGTSNINSFFLFVETDGNHATGYSISGVGADYMLELHGWDQKVEFASLMRFDSTSDQFNWTSWTNIDSLAVATKAENLEAMANLPAALSNSARFVLLAQDNMPSRASSVSYPVPAKGGALVIVQEPGSGVSSLNGAIPASSSISLARLTLRCEGASGTLNSISPVVEGASLASPINEVSLSQGESETVEILIDSSMTPSQSLVSAYVIEAGVSSTFADVVVVGDPVRAYVSLPPISIQIDGAFGDWTGRITPDTDNVPNANPNINMTAVGSVNTTSNAAFYVSVEGQAFHGDYAPAIRGKPTSQGGGGGPVLPHRKTGEDLLRVYIDSDISNMTGELIQRSAKVIGADYLLEIDGINGEVVSRSLMSYSSGEWTLVSADIPAAADSQRIETSVPFASIGGGSSFVSIIETTDWRARSDWAWTGSALDPWVIDAAGNTYMSSDGSTWSYLGTPNLEPGDSVVDIAVSIGAQGGDIFLVTNTGRTYFWVPGTSTSWEVGETNPIDVASYSDAVSMSFYQNSAAWLLTENGSYFWLMDAHKSTKDWTYQDVAAAGVTDFTDLEYSGGTMYALRSGQNTNLSYSSNGNSFTSLTGPTGSTSNHTQFKYIEGGPGSSDDRIYVLCENGNIRYSSNGGQNWNALGDLPAPTGSNTTTYVGLGFDPAGYMWVVTDTGYTYRSTDTTTFDNFTCTGQSPISGIVAILPTTLVIPEFPVLIVPVLAMVFFFVITPRIKRKQ
jgi:hypothetical protein